MARYQAVLTAHNVDSCPLYEQGDSLVINLPEVDTEINEKICAFIVAQLLATSINKEKNMICEREENFASKQDYVAEFPISEGLLLCPRVSCEVSFQVKIENQERTRDTSFLHEETATRQALIERLHSLSIFSSVKARDLNSIIPDIRVKKYQPGQIVIRKGQPGRFLFVVSQGEMEVTQSFREGSESVIGNIHAGECFGEMSLLTGEPVSANICAAKPSTVLLINRKTFQKLMAKTPLMSGMFTKLLTQRLKNTNQRIAMVVASGMVGQLQTIHFPELIQTLSTAQSSGILHMHYQQNHGCVYFQQGEIVDATLNEEQGEECFFQMLLWKQGDFRFEQKEIERQQTIHRDPFGLLLEGTRRLDESTKKFRKSFDVIT